MTESVTMAGVAKHAEVHVTTVSRALRNDPSLPAATRERIRSIAMNLGYHPNPVLQALVKYRQERRPRRDMPLAYLTHWDTRWGWKKAPAHLRFFTGATAKARQLGYKLEHFRLGEPGLTHQRMSDLLIARHIDGVIIASHAPEYNMPLRLDWPKFSAVRIDYYPNEPELHTITNDQRAVIQLAMQRVMSAGYRRIGFMIPDWWDEFVDLAWSGGFLAEQQRIAPEDQVPLFLFASPQSSEHRTNQSRDVVVPRRAFTAWFREHRPEVLISYRPFVQSRLEEMGLSVPRDVAFVDIFLEKPTRGTAGVRQNCLRVGEMAVELLVGQLQQNVRGIPRVPTATLVEGTWFEGKSLPRRNLSRTKPALRNPVATLSP